MADKLESNPIMTGTEPQRKTLWDLRDVTAGDDSDSRDAGTQATLIAGPEPVVPRDIATLTPPAQRSPFSAASVWVRKQRDARFGLQGDVASAILERLTAIGTSVEALPSLMVIVAHPDDEAIGAGAVLSGIPESTVVHVTDGAPRDESYAQRKGFPNREAYAQARRDEVVAALWIIGMPPERIRGLGFVDGEASFHLVELTHKIVDLLSELKPDVVLTHPYEGGHSDHDSTAFAVHLACGILRREGLFAPVIMELTSYHNYEGKRRLFSFLPFPGTREKTVELDEETKEIKRQMFDAFTSQNELLKTFPLEVERFRHAPRYLFTVPPHEGTLDYERLCNKMTGAEWRSYAEQALQVLRSRKSATPGIRVS
jgi:LmbE family N-acetylglucosaminyl deacetylase